MGAVRASYPRFRRKGEAPHIVLTDDDTEIIRTVHRYRFVRAEDLYRLFEVRSSDRLSRRLTMLYRAGYLDRPIAQIDRYGQGGSHSLVYGLDNGGARYLQEKFGTIMGTGWRPRNHSYTRENLDHTLAVSRFLVDLEVACRERPGVSLIPFEDILARVPKEARGARHPLSWTVPIQWHGGKADVELTPDAIFGLRVERPDGRALRAYFFVEVDRGTMTIVPTVEVQCSEAFPYRATILRKLYAYADSYRLRLHFERFGINAPRTLFLTKSESRANAMARAAAKHVPSLPRELMIFSSVERAFSLFDRLVEDSSESCGETR